MDCLAAEADDRSASLTRSAQAYATRCHARQWRASDGAPFIEHPIEVARLVRAAGCSEVVVAAALLHDVVERTDVSVAQLRAHFGASVADLVAAVSESGGVNDYVARKQQLREQVRHAGDDAALLFAADKIAKVRELPELGEGERTRDQQRRLEHYRACLAMLQCEHARHPLVERLAAELDRADRAPATLSEA